MNPNTMHIFEQSLVHKKPQFRSLYECECPKLARELGFREKFMHTVLADIQKKYPEHNYQELTYCAHGPGGLLFDFIFMNHLIKSGYRALTIIFIEELYQDDTALIKACLDFKDWCSEIQVAHPNKPKITAHFYRTWREYKKNCTQNNSLRANFLMCVDPDTAMALPNFESKTFLKTFINRMKKIMQPAGAFYFLFFDNKKRHMIVGNWHYEIKNSLIAYEHHSGQQSLFEQKYNKLFFNTNSVLPYDCLPNSVQINDEIIESYELRTLLEDPLWKHFNFQF